MNHTTHHNTVPAKSRRGLSLGIAAVSGIVCVAMAITVPSQFWPGYLVAANFWISISLGCLGLGMIHAITGGRWGYALGRSIHAGAAVLPLVLALGALLVIGASYALPWITLQKAGHLNHNQQIFLDPALVAARFVGFALFFVGTAAWLRGLYRREAADRSKTPPSGWAGFSLLIFFLCTGCLFVDYMMALSPAWASSMFPLIRIICCALSAMAVLILARLAHTNEPHHHLTDITHDSGNWMQAFNMLWAYLSISQYLLIWGGDLPMEVVWFLDRRTPWGIVASISLFIFHWVVPFILLLYRPLKKNNRTLAVVAVLLLFMCFVEICWIILPSIRGTNYLAMVSSVASVAFIGGLWVAEFSRQYAKLPDMKLKDIRYGAHHAHDDVHAVGEST